MCLWINPGVGHWKLFFVKNSQDFYNVSGYPRYFGENWLQHPICSNTIDGKRHINKFSEERRKKSLRFILDKSYSNSVEEFDVHNFIRFHFCQINTLPPHKKVKFSQMNFLQLGWVLQWCLDLVALFSSWHNVHSDRVKFFNFPKVHHF